MELNWTLHPKHINVQLAQSAAYQYRLQEWNDGQAELTVQHLGDRPSAKPVKNFVYKSRNAAFGGARRFEDQHGYRDDVDRINRLCAAAWDEGFNAGTAAEPLTDEWNGSVKYAGPPNPYRKTETTED